MDHLTFKGISDYGEVTISDQVGANLISWLQNAFLNVGAFSNVTLSQSGAYGGDFSRLRRVDDPYYTDGTVYEGARSDWVHESGIPYQYQPINISGIYINGALATSGYTINYPLGRIIFDSAQLKSSIIKCEYSYRNLTIKDSNAPWFRSIQNDSYRVDSPQYLQQGSGAWDVLAQSRVQLPAVVVDPTSNVNFQGIQLGGGNYRNQDVLLYVMAETSWDRNRLCDTLLNQIDKKLYLYDLNKISESGVYTLNFDGSRNPAGLQYPDLVDENIGYRKYACWIDRATAQSYEGLADFYTGVVRWTLRIPMYEI